MKLHNLKPAAGSTKQRKRIGRGEGSGRGGTSTRGHKGAQSRSGYSLKRGFEGGQMPLQRRVPKFGFTNRGRVEYKALNLSIIQTLVEKLEVDTITVDTLIEARLISRTERAKILGDGELTSKVNITAHAFSKTAKEKIEAQGGTVSTIEKV